MITEYQAQYYAHELIKRCSANSLEKLTGTLMDAQVDLNPHQVEAALFAFKSIDAHGLQIPVGAQLPVQSLLGVQRVATHRVAASATYSPAFSRYASHPSG